MNEPLRMSNGQDRLDYITAALTARPHRPSGFDTSTPITAPLEGKVESGDVDLEMVDMEREESDMGEMISPEMKKVYA